MGFSVSGSTVVIAVAVLLCTGTAVTTLSTSYDRITDARNDRDARELARANTDLQIVATRYDAPADALTVRANNTGTTTLGISAASFLVDDTLLRPDGSTVGGDAATDLWYPGEQLTVRFTNLSQAVSFGTAPSRVKVVTSTGVSRAARV
ncbi:MAG: fla cluster protein FlaF [Halorientalis sp.]